MSMDLSYLYLKNLAKRAANGEHIHQAEIVNLPKVIDKSLGNGDGVLSFDDIGDAVTSVGETIADTASDVIDFIISLF